jgi:SNF2 family DNA or RNA helicase
MAQRPAALLADSVGLGKTIQAIAAASIATRPRLVVCPNPLKDWWHDQIAQYCPRHSIVVCGQGVDAVPGSANLDLGDWVIVHWEAIRGVKSGRNLNRLKNIYWGVITSDEVHRIKNPKTLTAQALKQLRARQRFALTATPYANITADLFSILQWLRPDVYTSYWKFYALYVNYFTTEWGRQVIGPKNEKTLAWELQDIMLRREHKHVFDEVPPTTTTILPVRLESEQRATYELVRKEALLALEDGSEMTITNAIARTVRLRQVTADPSLINMPGGSAKLEALEALLDMSDEPVVVFTAFRDVARRIASKDSRSLYIGGSDMASISDFQEGRTDVLVGTISAMGEGLNLQRARRAIFVGLPWSQVKWIQATGRIRPGLDRPTEIIIIEARNTIDRVIRRVLEGKVQGAQAVYDALRIALQQGA